MAEHCVPGAVRLLESVDWTASYRDFKLAIAVLLEKFDEAVVMMKSIGKTGEILEQHAYRTWPLFTRFRERPEFYEAYSDIYGEAFSEKVDTTEGSVEAHAKSSTPGSFNTGAGTVIDGVAQEVSTDARSLARSAPASKSGKSKASVARKAKSSNPAVQGTPRDKAARHP